MWDHGRAVRASGVEMQFLREGICEGAEGGF